jgi:membrane-associated phospholipid phosphatase
MSLGVAVASTAALAALDHPTLRELNETRALGHRDLHAIAGDFATLGGVAPFAASSAIAIVSFDHPTVQEFAVHNAEAIALAAALTGLTKGVVGRALPDVSTRHAFELGRGFHDHNGPFVSFPSGHTAAAFAFASTVAGELARDSVAHAQLLGGAAFTLAAGVGVARVIQRVHWPSDLPLGAFIGLWSGYSIQARANRQSAFSRSVGGVQVGGDGAGRLALGCSSANVF